MEGLVDTKWKASLLTVVVLLTVALALVTSQTPADGERNNPGPTCYSEGAWPLRRRRRSIVPGVCACTHACMIDIDA